MTSFSGELTTAVLNDIFTERERQQEKWGEQNHPDGTGEGWYVEKATYARWDAEWAVANGNLSWLLILREEFYEAMAESDPTRLREELIQVAAVAVAWVEAIDRRGDR